MSRATMRKRPLPGSQTARVWELADDLLRRRGSLPSGREIADLYVAEGGNEGTAFTQYSHWKKAQAPDRSGAAPEMVGSTDRLSLRLVVDEAGRLALPEQVIEGMELGPERKVTLWLEDGVLRLMTPRVAVRRARAIAATLVGDGESVVDEFIAEKRREAARE